jgi:hypothetical protein
MTSNRHERRKTMVFEKKIMRVSDIAAVGSICAWDGCDATCTHNENEYLPKGWTVLLMFWSGKPVVNIWDDVPPSDMLRDAVLCPEHTRALDGQLKPLASRLDRETQGNA